MISICPSFSLTQSYQWLVDFFFVFVFTKLSSLYSLLVVLYQTKPPASLPKPMQIGDLSLNIILIQSSIMSSLYPQQFWFLRCYGSFVFGNSVFKLCFIKAVYDNLLFIYFVVNLPFARHITLMIFFWDFHVIRSLFVWFPFMNRLCLLNL